MPDPCALCHNAPGNVFGVCGPCWDKNPLPFILAARRQAFAEKRRQGEQAVLQERRELQHTEAVRRHEQQKEAEAKQEQRRAAILANVQSKGEAHG